MSRLTDKISSDYFESQNALNKRKGTIIEVFVENEDDVPFWKDIFNRFQIQTKINPASKTSLNRGKQEVLKMADKAGVFMLLCVDSDYDYLLNGATKQSRIINQNAFIFQTYTYSVENYKCYAESLNQLLIETTLNDNQVFECSEFIKKYSEIIHDLFLYSFFYERQSQQENELHQVDYQLKVKDLNVESLKTWQEENLPKHIFPISDFCSTIKFLNNIDFKSENDLESLSERVKEKLASLPEIENNTKIELQKELSDLGLSKENTYLFIQGHTLYNNVVSLIINPLYEYSKKQKIEEFKRLSTQQEEKTNKIHQYRNQIIHYSSLIQTHKYYHHCYLMDKIKNDIETYLKTHFKTD